MNEEAKDLLTKMPHDGKYYSLLAIGKENKRSFSEMIEMMRLVFASLEIDNETKAIKNDDIMSVSLSNGKNYTAEVKKTPDGMIFDFKVNNEIKVELEKQMSNGI